MTGKTYYLLDVCTYEVIKDGGKTSYANRNILHEEYKYKWLAHLMGKFTCWGRKKFALIEAVHSYEVTKAKDI